MPVVAEANFRQLPAAASLLTTPSNASTPMAASSSSGSGDASIPLMEVVSRPSSSDAPEDAKRGADVSSALLRDSTFTNGSTVGNGDLLHPWNGAVPDISRSPSVGDTFVSAAASSDVPYPYSSCDSTDDSESGPEDEEADVAERTPYGYITTATITLSGSCNSMERVGGLASAGNNQTVHLSSPTDNGYPTDGDPMEAQQIVSDTFLRKALQAADQEPSSSSGSTCISVSIGSAGEDSTERELNEPHVSVKLIAEKKGLFLKHSEYEIKVKGCEKAVRRRYKDFVTLHRYLAEKYPYRLLPTLPPKQLMLDSLLEERRRGLQAWLAIVSLHPVLGRSPIVNTFLHDTTTDHQYRLRVAYEKLKDELVRLRPDAILPNVDVDVLSSARTRLRRVQSSIERLKQLFDRRVSHSKRQQTECAEIDRILQCPDLRTVFEEEATFDGLSASERLVATQCERYALVQQRAVTERIDVLLEVLYAHSELCERIEKVISDQQRVFAKTTVGESSDRIRAKTKAPTINHGSALTSANDLPAVSNLDQHARRSAFAFSCAQAETLLAERYLQSLPSILLSYAYEEQQHHQKMSKIWHRLVVNESSRLD
uniref:PX domain-containing protein n=1 Tax=Anopheles farauti TaxID=69004 RepID=A0A182Q3D2_9DIPT